MTTRRRRLPVGITKTPTGYRITVRRKGQPLFQDRYPSNTPIDVMEEALRVRRRTMGSGRQYVAVGTISADVRRYLADFFLGRPGYAERKRHLQLWIAELGADRWRATITRDDVARVLNRWRAAGLAADTCNKRRTALLALFNALDGRGGPNPVRGVPKFRAPDPLPRGLAYDLIRKALKKLPRCKTRARLAVIAYTGVRHGQLMRLAPEHWDHKNHVLTVPGTSKGRGTKPYAVPLSPAATAALKEFDALEAWGAFTWAPMARMWKAAATKANLPAGTVPYDLRHSFGTAIYRATGDLKATKELLGHSALRMTERYMLAAVPERQQTAVAAAFPQRKLPAKVAMRLKSVRTRSK